VYFSDSPSLAVLEKLLHLDPDFMDDDYLLGAFEIDVSAAVIEQLTGFRPIGDARRHQRPRAAPGGWPATPEACSPSCPRSSRSSGIFC